MATLDKRFDARRAVAAGLAGSATYLAAQYADLRLIPFPGDDLAMLGMFVTRRSPGWRIAGTLLHYTNGTALALFYARYARNRLPGPPLVRGLLLGQIENALLWPLIALVIDRYNPAIRSGALPRFNTPAYALQAILRHLAYGAVLGWIYG